MSIAIWPPISPEQLKIEEAETQERELVWITEETVHICRELKNGLDDCYALLAPIDPGSTLVMSTPRNEKVKGTLTRVGTRIVKGGLNFQLRMTSLQTLTVSPAHPIHIPSLDAIHTNLTQSIDLLNQVLSPTDSHLPTPQSLSTTLTILSKTLSSSCALLKGPPLNETDRAWLTSSCPTQHFQPPLPANISFHLGLQECCVVLWLRALEPVNTSHYFGTKLGLAIGAFRHLEHDEMDTVFKWNPAGTKATDYHGNMTQHGKGPSGKVDSQPSQDIHTEEVYVREKVRVESADPSLISLHAKLGFLSHMLAQARRNLAIVMDVELQG